MSRDSKLGALAREVSGDCLVSRVRKLGRVLNALYQDELDPHRLTVSQFNLLTALVMVGRATPARLCAIQRVEKSTLSRNLALMERAGLVEPAGAGRRTEVALTRRGEQLYQQALPAWRKAQTRARRLLGAAGTRALVEAAAAIDEQDRQGDDRGG